MCKISWVSFERTWDWIQICARYFLSLFCCESLLVAAYATNWSLIRWNPAVCVCVCLIVCVIYEPQQTVTLALSLLQYHKKYHKLYLQTLEFQSPSSFSSSTLRLIQSCGPFDKVYFGINFECRRQTYLIGNTWRAQLSWSISLYIVAPPALIKIKSSSPRSQEFLIYRVFLKCFVKL
jgi:hypothetical protein